MNELKIFENKEFSLIKQIEKDRKNDYVGFVYVLEWGDAIKIGSTLHPYQRLIALKRQAEKYGKIKLGRFALTIEHTNYKENEKSLHKHFQQYRITDTELFNIPIQRVVSEISECVTYLDASETIEQQSEKTCNFFKEVLRGIGR